jgi:tripartite-type tricarboxylate transporter receptor subunit TctC
MNQRTVVRLFAVLIAATVSWITAASAQNFPAQPVTLIVPWPAGGTTDATLRALASATEKHLGKPIVIENRPGASATVGAAQMAASKPDGYTLAQIPIPVFRAPFIRKTTYDPREFSYVIGVSVSTIGLVVRSDAPWMTFEQFLADAKAAPGKINYATSGADTLQHFQMKEIARRLGIEWTHVPFKGVPESVNALLGGHIHAIVDTTLWAPQVNAGQLRLLVIFGSQHTKSWPQVPILKETGIDMGVDAPYGLAGPKGIDPKVVAILHDAFKKGMAEPSFLATLAKFDQQPFYLNTADYHAFAMKQIDVERRMVDELGLKLE